MNSDRLFAGRALRRNLGTATFLSVCALVSVTGHAFAQGAPSTAAEPPAPATAAPSESPEQSEKIKEATARFERGLALYDDGDFDAALVEFIRAYGLSPTYKIIYNIAKIERVRNDYSSALMHFQRYLALGGAEVPPERREEVEKEIAVLKQRVGQITIKANVDGATVFIDDTPVCGARMVDPACVGVTPLPLPVIVNPGTRKITAIKQGYQNALAQLTIAGGDQSSAKLELFDLKPPVEDTGPRTRAIVAWSVTGALAIGAGVMGVLTLEKKKTYNDDRNKPSCDVANGLDSTQCNNSSLATLDSDRKDTKTFALVTDILAGTALVGGAISVYLTVKASNKTPIHSDEHAAIKSLRLSAGPGSAFLSGAF